MYLIHKRSVNSKNETLCEEDGFKIYLSGRVTCPKCLELMAEILAKVEDKEA